MNVEDGYMEVFEEYVSKGSFRDSVISIPVDEEFSFPFCAVANDVWVKTEELTSSRSKVESSVKSVDFILLVRDPNVPSPLLTRVTTEIMLSV